MITHRRLVTWMLVAGLLAAALAGAALAQQVRADYDTFGNRVLIVDGWRLVLPAMTRDPQSGALWLDWQYPDGTGRGFGLPLDDHLRNLGLDGSSPHHLVAWFREGEVPAGASRQSSFTLPGFDLEYTAALLSWWEQGNDGCFDLAGDAWAEIDCGEAAPAPGPAPDGSGAARPCEPGENPFGSGCVAPSGEGSTSMDGLDGNIAAPPHVPATVAEALAALGAAEALCRSEPTSENCAARDRAYQAYVDLMQRGP